MERMVQIILENEKVYNRLVGELEISHSDDYCCFNEEMLFFLLQADISENGNMDDMVIYFLNTTYEEHVKTLKEKIKDYQIENKIKNTFLPYMMLMRMTLENQN